MPYGRSNPSPRYLELIALYRQMHVEGERFLGQPPENTFSGRAHRGDAGDAETEERGGGKNVAATPR